MLGVAAAVPTDTKQKILAFLIIAPTIYFLNLLRNAFVIMAYTEQWFPYWPEIAGNGETGYESFFWAHNVIAEITALIILVMIAYGLFTIIPKLGNYADDLYQMYAGEVRKASVKINNPLDCGQVRADRNDDDRSPDKTGDPAEDQDKERLGPPEKSHPFQRVVDLSFNFFPVPDLGIDDRLDERVHQGAGDREATTAKSATGGTGRTG